MQEIFPKLNSLTENSTFDEIRIVFQTIGDERWNPDLRSYLGSKMKSPKSEDAIIATIVAAGMYGFIPRGLYTPTSPGKIDPFLHNLRKAMLSCPALDATMRDNSRTYIFYPEFGDANVPVRQRIAAAARAHSGLNQGDDRLVVLFSLGGFFTYQDTQSKLDSILKVKGTTCVMTARAVYQAAGVLMFGLARPPQVGTSQGPQVELGIPTIRTLLTGGRKEEASIVRADQEQFGLRGYNNDDKNVANMPPIQVGDIYYVDGDGKFNQLLRPGFALAAHVGIVVARNDDRVSTVDGGDGTGAKISTKEGRKLRFVDNAGWTLDDAGKSFTKENVGEAEGIIAGLGSTAAAVAYMRASGKPGYKANIKIYEDALAERMSPKIKGNAALEKMIDARIARHVETCHRSIREAFKSDKGFGQTRTLAGWWKPEQYSQLPCPTRQTVAMMLNQMPAVIPNARRMTIEAML